MHQIIADCQLPIADYQAMTEDQSKLAIGNRQSAMFGRVA
jgi:hypothetical protein